MPLEMHQSARSLRFVGGVAFVDGQGLWLRPWYYGSPVLVPWSNVEFACPVPFLVSEGGSWRTYSDIPLSVQAISEGLRIYNISFVLRERQQLWHSFGVVGKGWLLVALGYKALMGSDDKFERKQGVIELDLHKRKLRTLRNDLVAFLDGVRVHSKFDLVGVGG
jgi:hypothetical protein